MPHYNEICIEKTRKKQQKTNKQKTKTSDKTLATQIYFS